MKNGNQYKILLSKNAVKDKEKLKNAGLDKSCRKVLDKMVDNPFCYPPPYERLIGDLDGYYSRRINRQHRIVYKVSEEKREIYIFRMWTHYDK